MILVDAGPLYAYHDTSDQHHQQALRMFQTYPGTLFVPMLIISEVAYLLTSRLGTRSEIRFLDDIAHGDFAIEPVEPVDWPRIAQLVAQYQDLPLGTVDASVVAIGERLGIRAVATFDHRHFAVVRPNHVDAFDLLP